MIKSGLLVSLLFFATFCYAQVQIRVSGVVVDSKSVPLKNVSVSIDNQNTIVYTNEKGEYNIYSRLTNFKISFSLLGYASQTFPLIGEIGTRLQQNLILQANINELELVTISQKVLQLSNTIPLPVTEVRSFPLSSANFESILKTMPGVSVNNELTAQYSVRGGNYDDNALYLNDIEIDRPIYVRNSQHEGLSFVNPDLASRARFSAGGYEARFADKLASVLDVNYDAPEANELIIAPGILNSSVTLKRKMNDALFLFGARYKNNGALLSRQDVKGRYNPNFGDIQALYSKSLTDKLKFSVLGNINGGVFNLEPEDRYTDFGTQANNGQLYVRYDGIERTSYFSTGLAATASYYPSSNWSIKWMNSFFSTVETENTNVLGSYHLDGLSDSGNFGTYQTYIDNFLKSNIFISEFKVEKKFKDHVLSFGTKLVQKHYREELNEISQIGSSILVPGNLYQNFINHNRNQLNLANFSAFVQDSYQISKYADLQLGTRLSFSPVASKMVLSPRMLFAYRPAQENTIFRLSLGVFHQEPGFRTLKNMDGYLVPVQDFQRSYNATVGYDYAFNVVDKRLKFSSELYYKYTDRMIPYMMDNLKIRYFSNQLAIGKTYGLDLMLAGELVEDLVSYFRVSVMKADQRAISNPLLTQGNPEYIGLTMKRPTDQRFNISAFFQDKLMNNPSYKVHLNMVYGSRLPIGQPDVSFYSDRFSLPSYKRIDIGFSKDFLDFETNTSKKSWFDKYFAALEAYVEVFNLLNMNNTASYLWLRDVNNAQYGIPNYGTGRQLNIRLIGRFKNK